MLKVLIVAVALMFALAAPARAEVVSRGPDGFTLRYAVNMEGPPEDIRAAMAEVGSWWASDHTYSGDARNLSLDLSPGGCWCERLASGEAFDHGRTVSSDDAHLVFQAPFGPLRGKTTKAELTIEWPPANRGRTITWTFVVEGAGIGAMADPVDGVMQGGFSRFLHFLHYGETPPDTPAT